MRVHSILFDVPVRADQDHFDIRGEVRPHWSATVGPVTLVMDGAGGWVGWWADQPGDPKQCVGLLPPTGVGLQLDLPGRQRRRLRRLHRRSERPLRRAAVTLTIGPPEGLSRWAVTAFGLHELTGSPNDTDRGRTFVSCSARRSGPASHSAYGHHLDRRGRHRRHTTAEPTPTRSRERLTSGAVGNILFADDPVRNAPMLLGDLAALFPPKAGVATSSGSPCSSAGSR